MTNRISRREFGGVMAGSVSVAALIAAGQPAYANTRTRLIWWGNPERDKRTYAVVDKFLEMNGDTTVDPETYSWGDYWTKLATLAAGKNLPDVIQMDYRYIFEYARRGQLAPLGDFIGNELELADFDQNLLNSGKIDGKLYGIAMGANDNHTVKVMQEAGSYSGPSLIIAYSHCIAHGYDLSHGLDQQRRAVASGIWPLYRFDPRRVAQGLPALQIDSKPPSIPVGEYMSQETRFRMVEKIDPERFRRLSKAAQRHAVQRVQLYQHLAALSLDEDKSNGQSDKPTSAKPAETR